MRLESVALRTGVSGMGYQTRPDIRPLHNRILVGDCLTELKKIPANSVDLVFADPPYNL